MTGLYSDVHEIRPGLSLGSRPEDPTALGGRIDVVLDLRRRPREDLTDWYAAVGITYRHLSMADGHLSEEIGDAGASRSATLVALYLCRKEGLDADATVAALRRVRPIVQPHPVFVTFLRQATGVAYPAANYAYLLDSNDDRKNATEDTSRA